MIDADAVADLKAILCDRFTSEELIEVLGVSSAEVFERFFDECLELDLSEVL